MKIYEHRLNNFQIIFSLSALVGESFLREHSLNIGDGGLEGNAAKYP